MMPVNPPPGGGLPHERGGDACVSLRAVNFGFWSHLGCSRQNAVKVSFRVAREEILINYIFSISLLDSCKQSLNYLFI